MDVHVPAAITDGLRRAGIDVLTAQDDGAARFTDEDLLHRATQRGRLLFTQDEDLLKIAAVWQLQSRMFSGIVYAHQLGPGIGRIIEDLALLSLCAEQDEVLNRVLYLPLV